MSLLVFLKLGAIFVIVAIGYVADRARWLGEGDVARVLSNAAFYLFVPALLFRTTAHIDLGALPWRTLAAFFVPALGCLIATYLVQRRMPAAATLPAAPGVRALAASFGNTVQLGIPMVTALFGVAGLEVHLAIVSLHALLLLTTATTLVELDLARARAQRHGADQPLALTLASTVRNTVIHPVVLPVLAGLLFNLGGVGIAAWIDETLLLLAQAVVPVCLVVIGMSLAHYGVRGALRGAIGVTLAKLALLPAIVLVVGHWIAGLSGMPLAVIVICAALPVGSNPLLFAQRYETLEHEAATAAVISTFAFAVSAPLWLLVLGWIG